MEMQVKVKRVTVSEHVIKKGENLNVRSLPSSFDKHYKIDVYKPSEDTWYNMATVALTPSESTMADLALYYGRARYRDSKMIVEFTSF